LHAEVPFAGSISSATGRARRAPRSAGFFTPTARMTRSPTASCAPAAIDGMNGSRCWTTTIVGGKSGGSAASTWLTQWDPRQRWRWRSLRRSRVLEWTSLCYPLGGCRNPDDNVKSW